MTITDILIWAALGYAIGFMIGFVFTGTALVINYLCNRWWP